VETAWKGSPERADEAAILGGQSMRCQRYYWNSQALKSLNICIGKCRNNLNVVVSYRVQASPSPSHSSSRRSGPQNSINRGVVRCILLPRHCCCIVGYLRSNQQLKDPQASNVFAFYFTTGYDAIFCVDRKRERQVRNVQDTMTQSRNLEPLAREAKAQSMMQTPSPYFIRTSTAHIPYLFFEFLLILR
jgi:hypothetical protein